MKKQIIITTLVGLTLLINSCGTTTESAFGEIPNPDAGKEKTNLPLATRINEDTEKDTLIISGIDGSVEQNAIVYLKAFDKDTKEINVQEAQASSSGKFQAVFTNHQQIDSLEISAKAPNKTISNVVRFKLNEEEDIYTGEDYWWGGK